MSVRSYAICSSVCYVKSCLLVSNAVLIYGQIYHTLDYSLYSGGSRLANGGRMPPTHTQRSRVARSARDYLDETLSYRPTIGGMGYNDQEAYLGATMWDSGIFYPLSFHTPDLSSKF